MSIAGISAVVLAGLACPVTVQAVGPFEPLPAPFYCFDSQSPSVQSGFFGPADVLTFQQPHPESVVDGCLLGLCDPADYLIGLSSAHAEFGPNQPVVILFSIDRETVGLAAPDPEQIARDVPYNARDQAWRGQAAGDQFISSVLFTLVGGALPGGRSGQGNGTLCRNNFDEGGTEFVGVPQTSASTPPLTEPQDNVICTSYLSASARGGPVQLYFTAGGDSPSLPLLAGLNGNASGATVLFNSDPQGGATTEVYVPFYGLGLQQPDNIDALIVFDTNGNGIYDGGDAVLFSLTPGSPSLLQIEGASPVGAAADVFIARPGFPARVFARAELLGLGAPSDNVDAIELYPCPDALGLAARSGIRALRADLNCDDRVDVFDIDPFVVALTDPARYGAQFPGCHLWRADVNRDGLVNVFDIDPFVMALVGGTLESRPGDSGR